MAKRIIDGKTYNTETATKVAEQGFDFRDGYGISHVKFNYLYQTRHGAYFKYYGDEADPEEDYLVPLSPLEAQQWMEKYADADLIERHFGEMPEAGEAESRFTLRMPDSLKQLVDESARSHGQSTNAWIIRCLESFIKLKKSA